MHRKMFGRKSFCSTATSNFLITTIMIMLVNTDWIVTKYKAHVWELHLLISRPHSSKRPVLSLFTFYSSENWGLEVDRLGADHKQQLFKISHIHGQILSNSGNMCQMTQHNYTLVTGPWEKEMATPYSRILAWKNSTDRGAWWTAVHGVTKSRTRLNNWITTESLQS